MTTATDPDIGMPSKHDIFRTAGPTIQEPTEGLPVAIFLDAHNRAQDLRSFQLGRLVTTWQGTASVFMSTEPALSMRRVFDPAWAVVDQVRENIWRIIRAEPDPDIDALLDPDVDPTRSQDWSTRAYRLSETPDTSIPDFNLDDDADFGA